MDAVPSLFAALGQDLPKELYFLIFAEHVLLDLFGHLTDILLLCAGDELVDDCMVLFPLAALEGDNAVVLPIAPDELIGHHVEGH